MFGNNLLGLLVDVNEKVYRTSLVIRNGPFRCLENLALRCKEECDKTGVCSIIRSPRAKGGADRRELKASAFLCLATLLFDATMALSALRSGIMRCL
jgi:hypothetical protein